MRDCNSGFRGPSPERVVPVETSIKNMDENASMKTHTHTQQIQRRDGKEITARGTGTNDLKSNLLPALVTAQTPKLSLPYPKLRQSPPEGGGDGRG